MQEKHSSWSHNEINTTVVNHRLFSASGVRLYVQVGCLYNNWHQTLTLKVPGQVIKVFCCILCDPFMFEVVKHYLTSELNLFKQAWYCAISLAESLLYPLSSAEVLRCSSTGKCFISLMAQDPGLENDSLCFLVLLSRFYRKKYFFVKSKVL